MVEHSPAADPVSRAGISIEGSSFAKKLGKRQPMIAFAAIVRNAFGCSVSRVDVMVRAPSHDRLDGISVARLRSAAAISRASLLIHVPIVAGSVVVVAARDNLQSGACSLLRWPPRVATESQYRQLFLTSGAFRPRRGDYHMPSHNRLDSHTLRTLARKKLCGRGSREGEKAEGES